MKEKLRGYILATTLILLSFSTYGDLDLSIPVNTGSNYDYAYDQIRTNKIDCKQSLSTHKKLEVGVIDGKVYSKLIIPIGKRPKRFDCSRLYELLIKDMEMRLMRIEAAKEE